MPARAEIVVDLAAVRHNVRRSSRSSSATDRRDDDGRQGRRLRPRDGAGGRAPPARPGPTWLGVATIDEALALRAAGDTGRVLCWLTVPGEDYAAAVAADVDVTAYSVAALDEMAAAGVARVQLKVDTGLSRGGRRARRLARTCSRTPGDLERAGPARG